MDQLVFFRDFFGFVENDGNEMVFVWGGSLIVKHFLCYVAKVVEEV